MKELILGIPKAELHVHVEGTLEPEMMLALAERNGVKIPFQSVEQARAAYQFADLQSFLDVYYQGSKVLRNEEDFFDLSWAYLQKAARQNVRHVELFFDPQSHARRGVAFGTVIGGITAALDEARRELRMSSRLIMCFLRHLSAEHAMNTLEQALPFADQIAAVGLDSSECGHPPSKFSGVFDECRERGFLTVAHAGEEGPPEYISQALDLLRVKRVDHGVRCMEDRDLVKRLAAERIPLTVCPLSNVKLRVVDSIENHPIRRMMEAELLVTVNSDDPPYLGGYVAENLLAVQQAFEMSQDEIFQLARNSFHASFLEQHERDGYLSEVEAFVNGTA